MSEKDGGSINGEYPDTGGKTDSRTVRTPISVDPHSSEPVYRQLRQAIEHQILNGGQNPQHPLPSSRELARELGLSRNTINAAYQELQAEGFIEPRARRGFFVNTEMLTRSASDHESANKCDDPVDWSRHLGARLDAEMPEITKVRDWDRYPYPFVAGQLDVSDFPRLAWARALREALDPPHLHYSLRDGVDEDDPLLVEMLCRHVLPSRGIQARPEEVLVTSGSQQGLDLLAHTLVKPGQIVGVEDPGYADARHTFVRAGAGLRPLQVDDSGMVPPEDWGGIKLLYLTPSHHSPTNVTLSGGRRQQILAGARAADALIIEDDYDSEFRYGGKPTPALKALPHSERVIYLGSFTKFLAPGLRLGYLVGDAALVSELRNQRRYRLRHISGHLQRAMGLLIDSGQYRRTIRRRRTHLRRKWNVLAESLNEALPWSVSPPPGGVSIWLSGPPGLDCVRLAREALDRGVVIERGDVFFSDPEANRRFFRLGFAAIDLAAIEPGVHELAQVIERVTD